MPPARAQLTNVPGMPPGSERQSRQALSPSSASMNQGLGLGFSGMPGVRTTSAQSHRKGGRSPTPTSRNGEARSASHYGSTPVTPVENEERRPKRRASSNSNGTRGRDRSEERKQSSRYLSHRSPSALLQTRQAASEYGQDYYEQGDEDEDVPLSQYVSYVFDCMVHLLISEL